MKNKSNNLRSSNQKYGYLFISLWLLGLLIFVAWPLLQSIYYSFCNVKITAQGRQFSWAGIENYANIWLKDIYYVRRLLNFIISTVIKTPLILVIAMMFALLLNQKILFRGFFRTIFFLPVVIVSGPVIDELNSQGSATIPLVSEYGIYELLQKALPAWAAEPIGKIFSQLIICKKTFTKFSSQKKKCGFPAIISPSCASSIFGLLFSH